MFSFEVLVSMYDSTRLFWIAFQSISLLTMIIHIAYAYVNGVSLSNRHCWMMGKIFLSFWQHLLHTGDSCAFFITSSKLQYNPMLDFVLSSIPAENFVSIQHYQNKFRNGALLIKNEFLRSRIGTLQFFRENCG